MTNYGARFEYLQAPGALISLNTVHLYMHLLGIKRIPLCSVSARVSVLLRLIHVYAGLSLEAGSRVNYPAIPIFWRKKY